MFRYNPLFVLLCCLFSTLCHADWTPSPPSLISPIYTFTYGSVFNSCNPTTGVFLATWADGNNNQYPTYSFFTPGTGWSPINTISTSASAVITSNVLTSCDPASGTFLATWTDPAMLRPTSSLYTPGIGWSLTDPLLTTTTAVNTANSFDSATGQFLVTWASSTTNLPTYSFYTPGIGWGSIGTISVTSIAANVYTSYDPTANQFLAVWVDIGTGRPMYSFYASGIWSPATPISVTADVDNDILCSYNPVTGQFIATWADINQNLYPFYSIYTPGTGWSPAATITTSSGVTDNVTVSCNLSTGQFLASWSNVLNGNPTYSFYTPGTGWSQTPGVISTVSSTGSDIITSFNSMTGQFLATWSDRSNPSLLFDPTYSFLSNLDPVSPPSTFTGSVVLNSFLSQTDIVHKLVWTPPANASSVVSYQINRNGASIATVPASGPFVYYDHNRSKKKVDVYTIVSVDASGGQSTSLTVTLP